MLGFAVDNGDGHKIAVMLPLFTQGCLDALIPTRNPAAGS
jgi:hypothetical protein